MSEVVSRQLITTENRVHSQASPGFVVDKRPFSEYALNLPYNGYRISFPWVKWRGRDSEHPLQLVVRLKKE
jgi:hypothetical protein